MNRREFFQFLVGAAAGASMVKAVEPKPPIYVITVPSVDEAQLAECRARFNAIIEEYNRHSYCVMIEGHKEDLRWISNDDLIKRSVRAL